MLTDRQLIWQYNRGRSQALHQIYQRTKDDLVSLAAALLTDRQLAEDVVHDVFVGFARQRGRFRLTGSLKGYLATCVANAARNTNRSQRRRSSRDSVPFSPGVPEDPVALAVGQEETEKVRAALATLPYEQREVLVLRAYGAMTFAAIAAQQQTSLSTVQGRYRYALAKVRHALAPEDPAPVPPVAGSAPQAGELST